MPSVHTARIWLPGDSGAGASVGRESGKGMLDGTDEHDEGGAARTGRHDAPDRPSVAVPPVEARSFCNHGA